MRDFLHRRRNVLGLHHRNSDFVYEHNPRTVLPFADDKLLCKEALSAAGVPIPPTLATFVSRRDLDGLTEVLETHERFVVKPARGRGGNGILVVQGRKGSELRLAGGRSLSPDDLRHHLVDLLTGAFSGGRPDRVFLERLLVPSGILAELSPAGLPDIRVITLQSRPVLAMLRLPTGASGGRANLHQGGLGVGVAIEEGVTTGGWWKRRRVDLHPETGGCLTGLHLPFWDEVVRISVAASVAVPLGYLGVDLTVDESLGPVVIEINARPGLEIQNVTGRGLRQLLEEGL